MSAGKRKKVTERQDAAGAAGEESGAAGEVGRLVDCSQADDRRMIRLVRERRLLYARNNMPVASYYSQVKTLWQEVADLMGWTVAEVRRKWSHIRNSYSRHLRNEMYGVRTGRGRIVSKWYLADELDFLRDHMATDTRPSRYSFPLFPESEQAARPELPGLLASPWLALGSPPPPVEAQLRPDDSSSPHSFDPDENSAYFHFFRGIHNDYQELPAKKQRLFRRECLAFLHRLLDEEEPQGQQDGVGNLADTDDERECKPFIIEHAVSSAAAEPEPDTH